MSFDLQTTEFQSRDLHGYLNISNIILNIVFIHLVDVSFNVVFCPYRV